MGRFPDRDAPPPAYSVRPGSRPLHAYPISDTATATPDRPGESRRRCCPEPTARPRLRPAAAADPQDVSRLPRPAAAGSRPTTCSRTPCSVCTGPCRTSGRIRSPLLQPGGRQIRRKLLDLAKHHLGPHGRGRTTTRTASPPTTRAGRCTSRTAEQPEDLEGWSAFHAQVEALPDEEREVVGLLFYEGLTQQEAATVLGVSLRTVKRRWQSARCSSPRR